MNVRVDLTSPIYDGMEVVFKAPCNASEVTGLKLCYQGEVHNFAFADANANDVGDLDNLFAEGAVVKVILDTDTNKAFIQNGDTNAYLENRFKEIGSGGGGGSDLFLVTIKGIPGKNGTELTADYYAYDICKQMTRGRNVVCYVEAWDEYIALTWADTSIAYFVDHSDDTVHSFRIRDEGEVYYIATTHAKRQDVEDLKADMGNVSEALDRIIEIQNALIGGDGV